MSSESNRLIIHTNKDEETGESYLSNNFSEFLYRRKSNKSELEKLKKQFKTDKNLLGDFYDAVDQQGYSTELLRTTMEGASDAAKDYAEQMKTGKGSVDDFVKSQQTAIQTLEISSKLSSSFKSFGLNLLSTGANMVTGLVLGAIISTAVSAIDEFIHRQEIAIENGEKARSNISEIADEYNSQVSSLSGLGQKFVDDTSDIETTGDALDSIASKYAELSDGVSIDNENISLNDDDYQTFLDISNQLADLYPSLVTGYDANGNAIINLGNNASDAAQKLRDLFEAQQLIAHNNIAENIQADYDGMMAQNEVYEDEISTLEKNIDAVKKQRIDLSKISLSGDSLTFSGDQYSTYKQISDILDEYDIVASESAKVINNKGDREYTIDLSPSFAGLSSEEKSNLQSQITATLTEANNEVDTQLAQYRQKLEATRMQLENSWQNMIPSVTSFLQTESTFTEADTSLQDAIIGQLENLDISSISDTYGGDIQSFLYGEIIQPISELTPEVQSSLADLFSLDSSSLSLKNYRKSVNEILNSAFGDNTQQKEHWSNLLGLDEMEKEYTDKINAIVANSDIGRKQFKSLTGDELEIAYDLIVNDKFSGTFDELQKEIDEAEKSVLDLNSHPLFTAAGEALETANKGAVYSDMLDYVKTMDDLTESGDIGTDEFKAIAKMFSPSGAEDYGNWAENVEKIKRYFTEDNSGVINFLEDLSEKTNESGEALAEFNEKTGEWSFNIDDLEKTAQKMGIGFEPLMAIFGELEDKGFYTDFFVTPEEGGDLLADLNDQLFAAEQELANLNAEGANNSAIEAKKQEIEQLKERIDATTDSLSELLNKDPEQEIQEAQRNTGLLKERKKDFNKLSRQDEYQTEEGRNALRTYGESLVTAAQGMGYENAEIQEVTDKKTGQIRLKLVLDPKEAEQELSKIENEEHKTKVKATVDASEIENISQFISTEDAEEKVVKLIGEDEATPIIDNWDNMEPIDKETTLTARDQATATLRLWNAAVLLEKQGVLTGEDLGTWVIDTWNSMTPEQKQAVLSANPDEANAALNEVLGLSGDLDSTTASPDVKVDGVSTARSQIASVSSSLDSLNGKTATTQIITERKTVYTEDKSGVVGPGFGKKSGTSKTGNNFNGTFHAHGTFPAYAQGTTSSKNVSIQHNEDALINELGEEGVVRNGQLLTFNNGYPTIAKLRRGDLVFNHKQMEALRKRGYITNSHAKIVGGESAFAQGTIHAYAGTGTGGGYNPILNNGSSSSSSSGSSSGSSSSSPGSSSKSKSSSKDKKDEKKENKFQKKWEQFQNWVGKFFDHIERRLERSSELIDKWTTAAENAVTISAQQTAYGNAISETQTSLSLNETASSKYLKQARKVGRKAVKTAQNTKKKSDDRITSEWVADIITKLQDGSLDITKYKGKERDVIDSLQEWVDKSTDAKNAISELTDSLQDLYTEMRNLANVEAEEKVDKLNDELDILGTELDRLGTAAEQNNNILRQNELSRQTMDAYQTARVTTSRNLGSASQRVRNLGDATLINAVNAGQKIEIQDNWSNAWKSAIADYNASLDANTTATTNARKATADYYATIQENAEQMFNNIVSEFEAAQNHISQRSTEIQVAMDLNEAQGYRNSANYYRQMITAEQENQRSLEEERARLNDDLNNKLKTGQVTYGTDAYDNMVSQINDVTNAINESKLSAQEFENSIQELEWSNFEKLQERIADITEEADFLINELSRRDLVDEDVAGLTAEGNAAMALYASEYGTMIKQVQQYQDEIDKVRQDLSNDPYNETLIDHLQELEEAQQDVISSAGDMKDAMIDLTSQALEAQKTALQDIISDYQDMMDLQNDAYDYQKSISDMVTDINNVQKQLSVYAGDDSEEARARIQQLQSDLRDKQESLEDTQRQKLTSDINNMFDDLMDSYSDYVDTIIDNLDDNFDKLIEVVNNGLADSKETILSLADKLGIDVSDELAGILEGNDIIGSSGEAVEGVVSLEDMLTEIANAKSTEEVDQIVTRLTSEEANRKYFGDQGAAYIAAQKKKQELEAQQALEQGKQDQISQSSGGSSNSAASQNNAKQAEKAAKYIRKNMDPAKQKRKDLSDVNKKIYDMTGGQTLNGNELEGLSKKLGITHNNATKNGNLYQKLNEIGLFDDGWKIRNNSITHVGTAIGDLDSFAKGEKNVSKDMLAITQEAGFEFIRTDDGMLTPLKKGDSVFSHKQSENLWEMSKHDPADLFSGARMVETMTPTPISKSFVDVGGITIGDVILKDVQRPDQFVNELKNVIKNNRSVKGVINETIDEHLIKGHNSLSVNRW